MLGQPAVTSNWETTEPGWWTERFTYTFKKNGIAVGSGPSAGVWNLPPTTPAYFNYILSSNSKADIGVWEITVTGTLTTHPNATKPTTSFVFTVTIINDCETPTVIDSPTPKTISNMNVAVGGPTVTQDTTFMNTIANTRADTTWCGAYTITWSPAYPSFMTYTYPTISLTSTNPADVVSSPYTLTMTITLTDFPTAVAKTKTF